MKTWTERIGIVVAAGVLSMMLNARSGETQQVSPRAGAVPAGGIIFQTGECWAGWAEYTPARGRYVVGLVGGGTEAGTVGTALGDRESRATGAHSHGSGTLAASYTRPTASYTRPTVRYTRPTAGYWRPTASYTRPTANYTRPSARYTRPTASYTRPTANYTRPTVRYTRPTARYTRPTVNHQHTHAYEGARDIRVDAGNDAFGSRFVSQRTYHTTGQSVGPRVSGGGVSLTGGGVLLTGGGVSLTGGGVSLRGGSVSLRGGSVSLRGGGVSLTGGSVSLTGGGVSLTGGGVSLTGGGVSLTGATSSAGRNVAAPYIQLRACRKL